MKTTLLYLEDFDHFRKWLSLDIQSISWQGKFQEEFELFWKIFFVNGLSVEQMFDRFEFAKKTVRHASIGSWFIWLEERFLVYLFINKNLSLLELKKETHIPLDALGLILSRYFSQTHPTLEALIQPRFQIADISSPLLFETFNTFKKNLPLDPKKLKGKMHDDLLPDLEITLYKEWHYFLKRAERELFSEVFNYDKFESEFKLKNTTKIFKQIAILLLVMVSLGFAIREVNRFYEKRLANSISILRPKLNWVDEESKYRDLTGHEIEAFADTIAPEELEKMDTDIAKAESALDKENFSVESEVKVTSIDELPKNFDEAESGNSTYEESENKYRDTIGGQKKIFRVMINSSDAAGIQAQIGALVSKYKATQVDKVKPGMRVPGGFYYNLFVPTKILSEFLAETMAIEQASVFESRTNTPSPAGKSRVFVWVKNI